MIKTQKPFKFTTGKIVQPDRELLKNVSQLLLHKIYHQIYYLQSIFHMK